MQEPLSRRASMAGILAAAAAVGGAAGTVSGGRATALEVPAAGAVLLAGAGVDPTGRRDSRAAVQAIIDDAPAGSTIVNPSGAVLRLDGGLTFRRPHTRITGSGEWRFRAGGTYSVQPQEQNGFLDLRADHCWVDGIHATNPDRVLNRGVIFLADFGRATDNTLIGFGSGIHVSPAGEFHDFTISGNHVLDLIGDGGGSEDRSERGESYGDGIMCWGAAATITGNTVTCAEGADARIGIHVEGLPDQAPRRWTHGDSMATISGNVVHGRFRRGIVAEQLHHAVITGNVVADSTWWCIALITSDHCVVSGNVLLYSRTSADTQGSFWGPSRSAIMLYRVGDRTIRNPVVVDNTIRVLEGAAAEAGLRISGNDVGPVAVEGGRIAGNRVSAEGDLRYGMFFDRTTTDLQVDGNRVSDFTLAGIAVTAHRGMQLRNNTVSGPGGATTADGVVVQEGTRLSFDGNSVTGVAIGLQAAGQSRWTAVRGNAFDSTGVGVDLRGSSGTVVFAANLYAGVDTPRIGLPAGAVISGDSA